MGFNELGRIDWVWDKEEPIRVCLKQLGLENKVAKVEEPSRNESTMLYHIHLLSNTF